MNFLFAPVSSSHRAPLNRSRCWENHWPTSIYLGASLLEIWIARNQIQVPWSHYHRRTIQRFIATRKMSWTRISRKLITALGQEQSSWRAEKRWTVYHHALEWKHWSSHKTFLLDQWKDRINSSYRPRKWVSKGSKFEHEGCDIVIASLQTMISRKHPLTGFGLTIYDDSSHER
jgi:hypothetical protein